MSQNDLGAPCCVVSPYFLSSSIGNVLHYRQYYHFYRDAKVSTLTTHQPIVVKFYLLSRSRAFRQNDFFFFDRNDRPHDFHTINSGYARLPPDHSSDEGSIAMYVWVHQNRGGKNTIIYVVSCTSACMYYVCMVSISFNRLC